MITIILSGVGGSTNWLPLILPLVGILLILKFGETIIQFIKRKRMDHVEHSVHSIEDANGQNIEHES